VPEEQSGYPLATAVLVEKGGRFYFYQPGIALIASGDSLANAYRKFVGQRRDFVEEIERFGFVGSRAPATRYSAGPVMGTNRGIASELGLFVAKCFIVLLLMGGLVAAVASLAPQGGITFADVVNKAGEIAKDVQSLPPDRKEALRQSVGAISRELAPAVDAWRNPPPPSEPAKPGR
jgi:hypothetical protein